MESLNSKILSLFREQISKSIGMQVKRFTVTVEVNGNFMNLLIQMNCHW